VTVETGPAACEDCLRRTRLLGVLAPYIEKVATGEAGSRSPQLLALGDEDLVRAVAPAKADRLIAEVDAADDGALRAELDAAGCWAVCRHRDGYPAGLGSLGDAPPALVCRGDPAGLDRLDPETTVTVVGARRATAYGRETARSLARQLAASGFTVVSGLAWGIDGAAHEGAVEGGFTVAVLGCGADLAYPRHHANLYERIRRTGLVISELPPGAGPWRWSFPARNRIMAALAAMTVVVEAAGRSGSLITSEQATDLGREVGAVPGPVNSPASAGTNQLIVDGARPVRDAQDVLDALVGPGAAGAHIMGPALEPELAALLDRIEGGESDADAVARALRRDGGSVTGGLARLELYGYLRRSFAGTYTRTPLPRP
jgi:DNA processing protein